MIIDGNMNVSGDDENFEQMAKNSIMDNITSEEAVFDLDIFTTKTSRNETNHFHIYVDDNGKYKVEDSNFVVDDLTPEEYGSLIHEYVHYIQHIQTLFGVNRTRLYARLYNEYRKYLITHEKVEMPLKIDVVAPSAIPIFAKELDKEGFQHYDYGIDEVEIRDIDIEEARIKHHSVRVGIYDFELNEAWDGEKGYHFGYWAIIEGMAHNIQLLIDPTVDDRHLSVPYKVVDRICEKLYPEIFNNKLLMISLCLVSLLYDNPGVGFFDTANHIVEFHITDGRRLYKESLLNIINFRGKSMHVKDMLKTMQDELLNQLKMLIGQELDYYPKVFHQTREELTTGESTLLNILYDDRINDKKSFNDILLRVYGFPFIESHESSLLQNNPDTNKPYIEVACLASWELLYKRLVDKSTKCRRYELCRGNEKHEASDAFSPECKDAQWLKDKDCILSRGFKLFGSHVVEWEQRRE